MEQKPTYMEQYNEFLNTYCRSGIHDPKKTALGLPPGTIIQGRYIAGCMERFSPGHDTITYIGLDMVFNRPVLIQEYFPFDNCERRPDGSVVVRSSLSGFFSRSVKAYVEDGKRLIRLYKEGDIITLYSCFEENNTGYLVTEYMIKNVLLSEILEDKGLLPPQEALAILKNLLRALRKCHDQGLYFGNLDAENVYVFPGGIVKLTGLSRAVLPDKPQTDAGDRGTWTDVYQAAMLFVQMIDGKKNRRNQEDGSWGTALPKEMQVYIPVIQRAMKKNTERRFQNAGEFLHRLELKDSGAGWNQERVVRKKKRLKRKLFLFSSALVFTAAIAVLVTAVYFTGHISKELRETETLQDGSATGGRPSEGESGEKALGGKTETAETENREGEQATDESSPNGGDETALESNGGQDEGREVNEGEKTATTPKWGSSGGYGNSNRLNNTEITQNTSRDSEKLKNIQNNTQGTEMSATGTSATPTEEVVESSVTSSASEESNPGNPMGPGSDSSEGDTKESGAGPGKSPDVSIEPIPDTNGVDTSDPLTENSEGAGETSRPPV